MNDALSWAAVLVWLVIAPWAPPACRTPAAEQYAVATVLVEAGAEPQLAQELVMGALVGRGCLPDPDYIHAYRAALSGEGRAAAAYADPDQFAPAAAARLRALWQSTLVQHYVVAHFDAAGARRAYWWDGPAACPRGDVVVGELRFC